MKRIERALLILLSVFCLLFAAASCKSDAEKALERAREGARQAGEAADRAQKQYEDLLDGLNKVGR